MSSTVTASISVCLVEDHRGTRESLAALLREAPSLRLLETYATAEDALRRLPAAAPEVALVDINLPGMSGIELVARLKEKCPQLSMLMLTTHEESDLIFESLRAGASGYLLKNQAHAGL